MSVGAAVLVTAEGCEEQAFYSGGDLVEVGNPIGDARVEELMKENQQTHIIKRTANFDWLETRGDYPDRIEDVKLARSSRLADMYAD